MKGVVRKALLALALVLGVAQWSSARSATAHAIFAYKYDVDSATLTYPRMIGMNNDPYGGSQDGRGTIKTSGSSTTVTENVASSSPFIDVNVGDVIIVRRVTSTPPQDDIVVVTAKASDASITVDTAVDWSAGFLWRWYKLAAGTASTDGWINVEGAESVAMTVQYEQGDLDALRVRWECRTANIGAQPVIVYPGESSDCGLGGTLSVDRCSFAAAGINSRLTVMVQPNPFTQCRVGLAFATTDTSDAGANLEQVTVTIDTITFTP